MAELTASGAVYEAQYGRSVVYRHGTCSVNHKSPETAANCRKSALPSAPEDSQTVPSSSDSRLTASPTASRSALAWPAAILGVGLVVGLVILLADPIHRIPSPAEQARSKPCPVPVSIDETPANITMPDYIGQNAGGVEAGLKALGLTNVELSSDKVRLDLEKLCLLVMIGVRADGRKELVALTDGFRESTESWTDLLRDCRRCGMRAPVLAVGDGALGFWKAVREVFPGTREQRCWWHKQANVLAALPKSAHPGALAALKEIYNAEDIDKAQVAIKAFEIDYGAKYPKAVAKIVADTDVLLEFYRYPAEHWIHLRTTNPIESTFATVRLRTKVTKGPGSRAAGLAMAYKLIEAAQTRWRAVNAPHLVALVRNGAVFHKGKLLERPIDIAPAEPDESHETEVA